MAGIVQMLWGKRRGHLGAIQRLSMERDRELVANLAAEGARLHETEMMGIAGLSNTHQTGRRGNEIEVLLVADRPRPLWHRAGAVSIGARIFCGARGVSGPVRSPGSGGPEIGFMITGAASINPGKQSHENTRKRFEPSPLLCYADQHAALVNHRVHGMDGLAWRRPAQLCR